MARARGGQFSGLFRADEGPGDVAHRDAQGAGFHSPLSQPASCAAAGGSHRRVGDPMRLDWSAVLLASPHSDGSPGSTDQSGDDPARGPGLGGAAPRQGPRATARFGAYPRPRPRDRPAADFRGALSGDGQFPPAASGGTIQLTKVGLAVPAGFSMTKFKARPGRRAPPSGAAASSRKPSSGCMSPAQAEA